MSVLTGTALVQAAIDAYNGATSSGCAPDDRGRELRRRCPPSPAAPTAATPASTWLRDVDESFASAQIVPLELPISAPRSWR